MEFLLQFIKIVGDSSDLNHIFLTFDREREVDLTALVKAKYKDDAGFLSHSMI